MEKKLVVVLVLYQTDFSEIPCYQRLKKSIMEKETVYLFIYDNSKKAQEDELFHQENVCYVHDETNSGLAKAYNAGYQYLLDVKGELMLLLDQDTLVDDTYLETLLQLQLDKAVGAYVPIVSSHGRQISPVFADKYIGRYSEFPTVGIYGERIMSINSGTVLPQETLKSIGMFNVDFPLDFLDHWLFWKIHQLHKKISVLDHHLAHDLSVLDYRRINNQRYESIIRAETLFYQNYDQDKFYSHRKQLLFRTIKQFLHVKNRKIWRRTFLEYRSLMKGK